MYCSDRNLFVGGTCVICYLESGIRCRGERQLASDGTMSLVEFCENGDLEGVKAALKNGADVNTKDEDDRTGLMRAVYKHHNSVVELLLKTPNIDVNQKDNYGRCALHLAMETKNNEGLKLLRSVPNIDVNIVDNQSQTALHRAVRQKNIEGSNLPVVEGFAPYDDLTWKNIGKVR